jgi:hypothetical protein
MVYKAKNKATGRLVALKKIRSAGGIKIVICHFSICKGWNLKMKVPLRLQFVKWPFSSISNIPILFSTSSLSIACLPVYIIGTFSFLYCLNSVNFAWLFEALLLFLFLRLFDVIHTEHSLTLVFEYLDQVLSHPSPPVSNFFYLW